MSERKKFWSGSLTWILDKDKEEVRKNFKEEFAVLNEMADCPSIYYPNEDLLTGGHFINLIKAMGWGDWESIDIHSFWISCTREERNRRKVYNWDELEDGQEYEILNQCECGGVWTHFTRFQKRGSCCPSCHTYHKPDNYTICDMMQAMRDAVNMLDLRLTGKVHNDTSDDGRVEEDKQGLQGCK